jgi:hypothetical protein
MERDEEEGLLIGSGSAVCGDTGARRRGRRTQQRIHPGRMLVDVPQGPPNSGRKRRAPRATARTSSSAACMLEHYERVMREIPTPAGRKLRFATRRHVAHANVSS